jgi:hypothetical protein
VGLPGFFYERFRLRFGRCRVGAGSVQGRCRIRQEVFMNGRQQTLPTQRVVHIKRDPYDLYIGRGSIWGNPFKIGPDDHRNEVLAKHKEYLLRGEGRHLLGRIGELDGKTLGCFCSPPGGLTVHDKTHCHGQLLLQLVELWRTKHRGKEAA